METEKTNRPKKIGTAIKLLYISLGIGTVQVILSAFTHVPKLSTISIILGVFILIGPMWLFIHKTWKGRNWARVALLLWLIIGLLFDIPSILQRLTATPFPVKKTVSHQG